MTEEVLVPKGEYALIRYDVHDTSEKREQAVQTYGVIYKYLDPIALRSTESVYIFRRDYMNAINIAFCKINDELSKRKVANVTFRITPVDKEGDADMRQEAVSALNDQVQRLAKSLQEKIGRIEKKFADGVDDVNEKLYKIRLVNAAAVRELKLARGLALQFLIEQDAQAAIEATTKVIAAARMQWELAKIDKIKAEIEGKTV